MFGVFGDAVVAGKGADGCDEESLATRGAEAGVEFVAGSGGMGGGDQADDAAGAL